jgi:hypothetical protein
LRRGELPLPDRASADRASGGCADSIIHNDVLYDLVDEGVRIDERGVSWHYFGYEPHVSHYEVFE